ncbi:MoaD/ThiS family protein [Caldilinea sp.]|uniref:MoaD/ThiS family protein n=1 Tax=Caldilinea sp. TaxID=2293560 RepID=UPI002621EB3A|nr:MoaD/ThiS family protein [uncultured Caldilinea sp.]
MAPLHEVWIPPVHRDLTAGAERVQVEAATVGEIVAALERRFPGLAARLTQGDTLRPGIAVAVNGVISTRGLRQRLNEPSEIHFVPAISGGSASSTSLAISGAYRMRPPASSVTTTLSTG